MRLDHSYLLFLLTVLSIATSSSLTPSPVLTSSDLVQCGCNNSALSVLGPSPSSSSGNSTPGSGAGAQLSTRLVITGFFSFNNPEEPDCNKALQTSSTTAHMLPAALIALDEINNSSDILHGYHLTIDFRDSRCDPVHAVTEYVDSFAGDPTSYNLGVLASDCGSVADTLGGLTSRSLLTPILSYGLNSGIVASMRGGIEFPSLFHVSRSTLLTMQSAVGFMRYFNWTQNIAFVSQDDSDIFLSTVETVVTTDPLTDTVSLNGRAGETISVDEFTKFLIGKDGLVAPNTVQSFFQRVQASNLRVILGLVSQRVAAELICTGQTGTIPGDGFVYVFVGPFTDNWWQSETESCTLTSADVQSVIVITGNTINPDSNAMLESGNTVHDFKVEYVRRLIEWCDMSAYKRNAIDPAAGLVYDSVWALALALNQSVDYIDRVVEIGAHQDGNVTRAILGALESVSFSGVTGEVQFSERERVGAESIQQIQGGAEVLVGWYSNGNFTRNIPRDFVWNGTSDTTPSIEVEVIIKSVDLYWLVIALVFTISGIAFAFAMCAFNWWYAKHKILLASSQKLNYIIIIGVIFGYLTVVILTILESPFGAMASDDVFKALCLIRIWTLPLSFTLSYGTLFARAWRIYRVFNNPWARRRPYKDYHLMLIVLGATAIDVAIMLPWSITDPYRRFPSFTDVDYDSFSRCVFFSCRSTNVFVWLFILGMYKIVIIACGITIISLVRKQVIARRIYDDSRSLAAAVYITAGAFIVGLPLTFLFLEANQVVLSYIISAAWVNVSSSGTLICIFLPKFYQIVIKKDSGRSYRKARRLYYQSSMTTTYRSQSTDRTLSPDLDAMMVQSIPVDTICSADLEIPPSVVQGVCSPDQETPPKSVTISEPDTTESSRESAIYTGTDL